MLTYCGECDERRPTVTLAWCEWCRAYHDYGKATADLELADSQLLEICPACGTTVPTEARDDDESPSQPGAGDVGGGVRVPAGDAGADGAEDEEVGF